MDGRAALTREGTSWSTDDGERPVGREARLVTAASRIRLRTGDGVQVVDLTPRVESFVAGAGVATGWVNVQSRHTTAAVVVNENEPLLLGDLVALLERLAPRGQGYRHDALDLRQGVPPDERPNGHSHAKALLLRTAETLNLAGGRLQLGRWQRVLLLELDGPRQREVSLVALGGAAR
jgi:secondary thiamine-phosphate synthase enzyme